MKLSQLPKDVRLLIEKFVAVGFFQTSKLSSASRPEQAAFFLHKSIQEFLSAWFIVQELMNAEEATPTCLTKVDSSEKLKKVDEVLKFVCELSSRAASAVFSHLQLIGRQEGLTEYSFTETPSVKELSEDQKTFQNICLDVFLSSTASDRRAIYPFFAQCINSVLVLHCDDQQLPIVARDHLLKVSELPKPDYLFFSPELSGDSVNDDVCSTMRDLETVIIKCCGDTQPLMEVFTDLMIKDFFLKKEGQQMVFYLTRISGVSVELLNALTSAPESAPQKPVDHVTQSQDNNSPLYLPENTSDQTYKNSLSFVREIHLLKSTNKQLKAVNNALPFVKRPRIVTIYHTDLRGDAEVQLLESLTSRITFTSNLRELAIIGSDLSPKSSAYMARSLHRAPNLQKLVLSQIPESISVSGLAENLHHMTQLSELRLSDVHMRDQECRLLGTGFIRQPAGSGDN